MPPAAASLLRKTTTFRGRLGYACLNTILRTKKPAKNAVFCSRTCRLSSIHKNGIEWVKDLGTRNVQDLLTIIQWNEDNHIRFLRMSSEMFPFASHPIHGYSLDYCAPLLAQVGNLANKYGHRLTTHPGQYTQLGSPKPAVIQSAVRELVYHCEMLDRMGIGVDGVMIVHGGGVYDDKQATLARIKNTITQVLPLNVRARLVLENDELCYNAEDLLPLCEELDVPLVFDYHHDALNPSSIPPSVIIQRANAIFARRGIRPKQHLSEPRPGAETLMEKRAHADRCENLPPDLPDDMDLMIEAKDKEQAVLQLYQMYNLHPVDPASVRPPDENPTKETKGRKSSKRLRLQAKEEVEMDTAENSEASFSDPVPKRKTRTGRRGQTEDVQPVIQEELEVSQSESLPCPLPGAVPQKKTRKGKSVKRRRIQEEIGSSAPEVHPQKKKATGAVKKRHVRTEQVETEVEKEVVALTAIPLPDVVPDEEVKPFTHAPDPSAQSKSKGKTRPVKLQVEQAAVATNQKASASESVPAVPPQKRRRLQAEHVVGVVDAIERDGTPNQTERKKSLRSSRLSA